MIGGIIERDLTTPKVLVCYPRPPSAIQYVQKLSNPKSPLIQSQSPILNISCKTTDLTDHVGIDRDLGPIELNTDNIFLIENMSSNELQSALEEINSLISSKNIQYLCNSNRKKSTEKHNSENSNEELRYDLEGRRVILKSSASQYFLNALMSVDKFCQVPLDIIIDVSSLFYVQMLTMDLIFIFDDSVKSGEPQNELFNHEQSPECPGYTMSEVCEVRMSILLQCNVVHDLLFFSSADPNIQTSV